MTHLKNYQLLPVLKIESMMQCCNVEEELQHGVID
jgi:hypothetical protein